jgi:multicomponent Na+:H+ antiporter subunit G
MSFAFDIVTIAAVSAGALFFLAGTIGLLRFPDTLTRLHALTKADVLLAGATVSQLIARVARQDGTRR